MRIRYFMLLIIFEFFSAFVFGQSFYIIDSLELSLESSAMDTNKVRILNELAFQYYFFRFKQIQKIC